MEASGCTLSPLPASALARPLFRLQALAAALLPVPVAESKAVPEPLKPKLPLLAPAPARAARHDKEAESGAVGRIDAFEAEVTEIAMATVQQQAARGGKAEPEAPASVEDLKAKTVQVVLATIREQARRAELSNWSLCVSGTCHSHARKCTSEQLVVSRSHCLTQDVDYATKRTGVSTKTFAHGFIQATFSRPVLVNSVRIAAFPASGRPLIAIGDGLTIQTQSPETGAFEVLHRSVPTTTTEEEFTVGKVILALRCAGQYVSISKMIFS